MDLGFSAAMPQQVSGVDCLTIEYKVGPEDFVAYWMHAWEKSLEKQGRMFQSRPLIWLLAALVGLVAAEFLFFFLTEDMNARSSPGRGNRELLWMFGVGGIVTVLLLAFVLTGFGRSGFLRSWARKLQMRKFTRRAARLVRARVIRPELTPHLSITPKGLTQRMELRENEPGVMLQQSTEYRVAWGAVTLVERTNDHLFITIPKIGGSYIVPARAFPDEDAFQHFADMAMDYHVAAPDLPPLTAGLNSPRPETVLTSSPPEERIKGIS